MDKPNTEDFESVQLDMNDELLNKPNNQGQRFSHHKKQSQTILNDPIFEINNGNVIIKQEGHNGNLMSQKYELPRVQDPNEGLSNQVKQKDQADAGYQDRKNCLNTNNLDQKMEQEKKEIQNEEDSECTYFQQQEILLKSSSNIQSEEPYDQVKTPKQLILDHTSQTNNTSSIQQNQVNNPITEQNQLPQDQPINALQSRQVQQDHQENGMNQNQDELQNDEETIAETKVENPPVNRGYQPNNPRRRLNNQHIVERIWRIFPGDKIIISRNYLAKLKVFIPKNISPLRIHFNHRERLTIKRFGNFIVNCNNLEITQELIQERLFNQQRFDRYIDQNQRLGIGIRRIPNLTENQRECLLYLFKQCHKIYFTCTKNWINRIYQGQIMNRLLDDQAQNLFNHLQRRCQQHYNEAWQFFTNRLTNHLNERRR